jgi:hypothetical protein
MANAPATLLMPNSGIRSPINTILSVHTRPPAFMILRLSSGSNALCSFDNSIPFLTQGK